MKEKVNVSLSSKDRYDIIESGKICKVLEVDEDGFDDARYLQYLLFSNGSNLVLFCKVRYEGEDIEGEEDIGVVIESLSEDYFSKIRKTLDSKKDIAVYVYQVYGSTSDVFLFDRSSGSVYCENASDIIREADRHEKTKKYIDITT